MALRFSCFTLVVFLWISSVHGSSSRGLFARLLVGEDAPGQAAPAKAEASQEEPYVAALDPLAFTHCNITGQCVACTREQMESEASCRATGFHQEITCLERFAQHESLADQRGGAASSREDSGSDTPGAASRAPEGSSADSNETSDILAGAGGRNVSSPALAKEDEGAGGGGEEGSRRVGPETTRRALLEHPGLQSRSLRSNGPTPDASSSSSEPQQQQQQGAAEGEHSAASGWPLHDQQEERKAHRRYVTFEMCSPAEDETLSVLQFEAIMLSLLLVCAPVVYQRKRKATSSVAMVRMPSSRLG